MAAPSPVIDEDGDGEDEYSEEEDGDSDDEDDNDEENPPPKPMRKARGIGTTEILLIIGIIVVLFIAFSGGQPIVVPNQVVSDQGTGNTQLAQSSDLMSIIFGNPLILLLLAGVIGVVVWFYQRRTSFTVTWVTNVGEEDQMPLEITMRVIYYRTISGILNYIQLTRGNRPKEDVNDVEIEEADESEAVLWVTAVVRSTTDRLMVEFQPKGIRSKQRGVAEQRILSVLRRSKRLQSFGMAISQIVIEDINDIEEVEETQAQAASAEMEGRARATAANSTVSGIQARRKAADEEPLSGVQSWVIEVITVAGEALRDIVAEAVTGKASFERPQEPTKTKDKGGKKR